MEDYLKQRPHKRVFPTVEISRLRNQAIAKVKATLLPNDQIIKILLIGSSIKDSFGEYDPPGFRGSLFSDFDFIVFVKDDYQIPVSLDREPDGKPFPAAAMNLAYRHKKFIDDKYDVEVFFLRHRHFNNPVMQAQGELAGIPMTDGSTHKHIIVYEQMATPN